MGAKQIDLSYTTVDLLKIKAPLSFETYELETLKYHFPDMQLRNLKV